MNREIQDLIDSYYKWLKDKTILKKLDNNWNEITTPYLDRHNDRLQIYLKKYDDEILLTDDGYIINDLILSGCEVNLEKRKILLKQNLAGFGVQMNENTNELFLKTTHNNFPQKKHNLLQAMIAINDLFYLSNSFVTSIFYDEALKWLEDSDIRYSSNMKFEGKSGYSHKFDFLIPHSKKAPERFIQTLNNPKQDNIKNLLFKWLDTSESRVNDRYKSELFVMVNDRDAAINDKNLSAIKEYGITPCLWSQRDDIKDALVA